MYLLLARGVHGRFLHCGNTPGSLTLVFFVCSIHMRNSYALLWDGKLETCSCYCQSAASEWTWMENAAQPEEAVIKCKGCIVLCSKQYPTESTVEESIIMTIAVIFLLSLISVETLVTREVRIVLIVLDPEVIVESKTSQ